MMLVDYASSDEEEELVKEEPPESSAIPNRETPNHENRPPPAAPQNPRGGWSSNQQAKSSFDQPQPSMVKLPDASLLLNSPASSSHLLDSDHSSRVAAAMAANASRKRTSNESASTYTRSKVPKGTLPHMRNLPDTAGGLLCPPQLAGSRSNVVTEDINKLFVRRPANPSSK